MSYSPISEDFTVRKCIAALLVLFVAYIYKETVFDPYFHPELNFLPPPPQQVVDNTLAKQNETPTSYTPSAVANNSAVNPAAANLQLSANNSVPAAQQGFPTDQQLISAGTVKITTENYELTLTKLGGRVLSLKLLNYARDLQEPRSPLDLVDHIEGAPLPLGVYSGTEADTWVSYTSSADSVTVNGSTAVVLKGQLPDGRVITKTLTFSPQSYLFDVAVGVNQSAADGSKLAVEWTKFLLPDSPALLDKYKVAGYVWFDGSKALRENFGTLKTDEMPLGDVHWVTLADKYFMATLINKDGAFPARIAHDKTLHTARVYGSSEAITFSVYTGPKDYDALTSVGFELQRNLNLGYTAVISAPLLWLLHLFHGFLGNYGLAIVLLTIMVKLATYPLAASSYKQMKGMQNLAPEMKRIKETVTDKQQQQMMTMQLYKEKGVNPVGGCLPIVLQMPIFIGLYSALSLSIELRHAPFMFWIKDLSAPEKLHVAGITFPLMVVLFAVSMLIQQITTPSNMEPAQKRMMLVMPLVFGFMFASMPAGLTLYWLTNNLISIGQQKGFQREGVKHALMLTLAIAAAVFALAFILVSASGTLGS